MWCKNVTTIQSCTLSFILFPRSSFLPPPPIMTTQYSLHCDPVRDHDPVPLLCSNIPIHLLIYKSSIHGRHDSDGTYLLCWTLANQTQHQPSTHRPFFFFFFLLLRMVLFSLTGENLWFSNWFKVAPQKHSFNKELYPNLDFHGWTPPIPLSSLN